MQVLTNDFLAFLGGGTGIILLVSLVLGLALRDPGPRSPTDIDWDCGDGD